MKLLTTFHLQINGQTKRTNQKLKQYLRIYISHRQSNWLKWLATVEFTFNNKVHIVTKSLLFKVNYERELKMDFEIRKKGKYMKAGKFIKKIKKIYKKIKAVLKKLQEKILKKYE